MCWWFMKRVAAGSSYGQTAAPKIELESSTNERFKNTTILIMDGPGSPPAAAGSGRTVWHVRTRAHP